MRDGGGGGSAPVARPQGGAKSYAPTVWTSQAVDAAEVAALLLLGRALDGLPFATIASVLRQPAPIVNLETDVPGLEAVLIDLLELGLLLPGRVDVSDAGLGYPDRDYPFDDGDTFRWRMVSVADHAVNGRHTRDRKRLRDLLGCAMRAGCPVLIVGRSDVGHDLFRLSADVTLATGPLDRATLARTIAIVTGADETEAAAAVRELEPDAAALTMEAVALSIRPDLPLERIGTLLKAVGQKEADTTASKNDRTDKTKDQDGDGGRRSSGDFGERKSGRKVSSGSETILPKPAEEAGGLLVETTLRLWRRQGMGARPEGRSCPLAQRNDRLGRPQPAAASLRPSRDG